MLNSDNALAPDWFRLYLKKYYYLPTLALWRALEARALGAGPIATPSLDVGGFDGSFASTWLLGRPPFDVGLDLTIRVGPDTARAYRSVVNGDAQSLPFPDSTFNSILCNSVIEHIPDDVKVLREFARVLRPGGVLMLTTPSVYFHDFLFGVRKARAAGDEERAKQYIQETDRRLNHLRYRSVAEWTELLSRAGLRVISHRYYLSPSATAYWDKWDTWLAQPVLGRKPWEWIGYTNKLPRILPPKFWYSLFLVMFEPRYRRSVAVEGRPNSRGGSVYIAAISEKS